MAAVKGGDKGDDEGPGMDRAGLKAMFRFARREPVRVAFALDKEGKVVLLMDKRKPPRVLDRELKEALANGRNFRFGTVEIGDDQPKLVKFKVNKASPGIARKLVVALRGTGFRKVEIDSEDDGAIEKHEEPGEDDIDEHELDQLHLPAKAGPTPKDAIAPAPAASKHAATDTGQLVAKLVGLVKQIREIVAEHPEHRSSLLGVAAVAKARLRDGMLTLEPGDLERVEADIAAVEQAVQRATTALRT